MGRGTGEPDVAGGLARHIPVLSRQVLELLQPRDGGVYLDGTFGAGGHTRAILAAAQCKVIAIDRDQTAIARGADLIEASQGRLTLVQNRFSSLDDVARQLGHASLDGILLDIGVSSMQLDEAERGFSFRFDGPLDMRMGGSGPSAADIVALASERNLASIIALLGEERHPRAVARAIISARAEAPIQTTKALADIVARVVRVRPGDIHPATRTFQALRIFVNEELNELVEALGAAERILAPGGRLAVISFHSLEDRIVKRFLIERSRQSAGSRHMPERTRIESSFEVLTKRPAIADDQEIADNPRARSAKLRAAERTTAPAIAAASDADLFNLPTLAQVMGGR
ncbi:MAG TPA: 16S rRNA (cytosine(1402)-N(4))-methyltransferase RsmH [Xanthobacteraceae bacterium]|nr:16S rRNA (cytosine(1402)-N(4))-methyltransferase RsmH [Xanthobacteraceae bacterium]